MDKLRADFEADFENETGWSAGEYPSQEVVDLCWRLYQQSRASIVVELPQRQSLCASGYGDGYFVPSDYGDGLEYDETVEAIRSIGLSIKGE
jgi:hypothetical protein